jgi:hypothetical protein
VFLQVVECRHFSTLKQEKIMTTKDKTEAPIVTTQIACDVCLREVPISEAVVPEAADYFAHFCGLECYQKWQNQKPKSDPKEKKQP